MVTQTETKNEIAITRDFNVPRRAVWRAWTEPEHLRKWWGPKDFTSPSSSIDLRVGGKYLNSMRGPDGKDYWSTGVYCEIVPEQRLVMTDSFSDEYGNVVPASHYGLSEAFPLELQVIVTFEEQDGRTRMTLRHIGVPEGTMSELTSAGWNESFDKLASYLNNKRGK